MGGVIMAIATLVIGFVLAGYGVYTNAQASQRTLIATSVGSSIERQAKSVQDMAYELERRPTGSDVDAALFARDSNLNVTYSYLVSGADGYVCATSTDVRETMVEGLNMVAKTRPGTFVSGQCGVISAAVGSRVSFSMKVS